MNKFCIKETTVKLSGKEEIAYLTSCGRLIADTQTVITGAALMLNIASKDSKMYLGAYYEAIPVPEFLNSFETVEYTKDYIAHLM